ncbi:MAG TPA: flagellar biosynthesis protein FlhA [Alphaproteobacteria bacterium]|nr:flagellar biosynthesis protein FlhA [Alphaproteobacteria bacterium]
MTDQSNIVADAPKGGLGGFDFARLTEAMRRGDVALAIGVVAILSVLFLPMPSWLLDMSLALSITVAVIILMTVLFISRPLDLSSFPTVLLMTTLLRLSLNVASSRLILSHGHEGTAAAGHVIEAFGAFVMSGNFVIGVIVFAILMVVNFVVITKGSGRIAEVAARFSLDAMPGKQMAIDADLSAGLIDESIARARRRELEDESAFYGAMDGASKFVRGDAVAGLIIVFVNIIGGMVIGTLQMGLTFAQSASSYTLLTVGDGLVTQIPALMVSIAAGLLVSKAGMQGTTDKAVFGQLSGHPAALGMTSVLLGIMALLPGLPIIPFAALSAAAGYAAYILPKKREAQATALATASAAPAPIADEPIATALAIDTIRLELGYGLLLLVNGESGNRLTDQIKALRRQLAGDMGFVLPSVRIQDNLQLPPNTYVLRIKEIEAGRGDIRPQMLLCMDPRGEQIALPGEATHEPTFGLPAMWIPATYREEAHFKGYTVVDPATVLTTHLTEVVKDNLPELLSYTETQKLLDELDRAHQKLVGDVVPSQITVTGLQRVLQNLLAERISIRDLPTILEGISEAAGNTRNVNLITEHVRTRLGRQICDANANAAGVLALVTLSPEWETAFAESIIANGEDRQLSMAPSKLQQFIASVRSTYDRLTAGGENPVLLTSPTIRPYVRSIIERFRPTTVVMSQNEIYPRARIKTLGHI